MWFCTGTLPPEAALHFTGIATSTLYRLPISKSCVPWASTGISCEKICEEPQLREVVDGCRLPFSTLVAGLQPALLPEGRWSRLIETQSRCRHSGIACDLLLANWDHIVFFSAPESRQAKNWLAPGQRDSSLCWIWKSRARDGLPRSTRNLICVPAAPPPRDTTILYCIYPTLLLGHTARARPSAVDQHQCGTWGQLEPAVPSKVVLQLRPRRKDPRADALPGRFEDFPTFSSAES